MVLFVHQLISDFSSEIFDWADDQSYELSNVGFELMTI